MKFHTILSTLIFLLFAAACKFDKDKESTAIVKPDPFDHYWNDGLAEITSYHLKQNRYGEIHPGEATLIFVKEPFSRSKQVKLDNWQNKEDRLEAMKLNLVTKFQTGIYPYSTMLSSFSDLQTGRVVKITNSIQEWCGQVFSQYNVRDNKVEFLGRSYFEGDGDTEGSLRAVYLEDELWNLIRIQPDALPVGMHEVIPGATYLRFDHHQIQIVEAAFELQREVSEPEIDESPIDIYTITYKSPAQRKLQIYFQSSFPHQILGWEETTTNEQGQELITRARIKKTIKLDYWNKNKQEDAQLIELLQ